MSRKANSLRNMKYAFVAKIIQYALSFATRTIFISLLNQEYLGIDSLFTNMLAILAIAEMGAGSAFISMLYKPIHENNEDLCRSLMRSYNVFYTVLAAVTAVAGIALTPFLDFFTGNSKIPQLQLYYFLVLAGFVFSYLFLPQVEYIIATQKQYLVTLYRNIMIIVKYTLQILLLLWTRDFLLYLIIQVSLPIIANILLGIKARQLFPFLRGQAKPLLKPIRSELKKKITGQLVGRFGFLMANSTDSLVISSILGLTINGIFSNYLLIISMIDYFIDMVFGSVAASVGDLIAEGNETNIYLFFERLMFLSFFLSGFSSICLIVLLNPFIMLWIGSSFTVTQATVVLAVGAYLIGSAGMRRPITIYRNTSGFFYKDRYAYLVEGFAKVGLSIWLASLMGLAGVLIGTILSTVVTYVSGLYVLYKHLFKRSIRPMVKKLGSYYLSLILSCAGVGYLCRFIAHSGWLGFIMMTAACACIAFVMLSALFWKVPEYQYFKDLFIQIIRKSLSRYRKT